MKICNCLVQDFQYLPSILALCQSRQNQFAPLFWSASYWNFTVIVQVGQFPRTWRGLRFSLGYGITRKTASRSSLPFFLPRLGCADERIEICENSDSAAEARKPLRTPRLLFRILFAVISLFTFPCLALPLLPASADQSLISTVTEHLFANMNLEGLHSALHFPASVCARTNIARDFNRGKLEKTTPFHCVSPS